MDLQNESNAPKWIVKMSQMHQNQWSEFAKVNQSEQNGHRNDPNDPKSIVKMDRNERKLTKINQNYRKLTN